MNKYDHWLQTQRMGGLTYKQTLLYQRQTGYFTPLDANPEKTEHREKTREVIHRLIIAKRYLSRYSKKPWCREARAQQARVEKIEQELAVLNVKALLHNW